MKWGEWDIFSTSVTWYKASNSWSSWVARLAITKLEKWKMLGINEAIHASKYDIPINPSLLIFLLSFWRSPRMHARYPEKSPLPIPTCFKLFSDVSRRTSPEDFMPFEAKEVWFNQCLPHRSIASGRLTWLISINEDDLIEAIQGAGFEHMASYVTLQPLQQISHSGKKVGGDPSSQKFTTAKLSKKPKRASSFKLPFSDYQLPPSKGLVLQPNAKLLMLKKSTLLPLPKVLNLLAKNLSRQWTKKSTTKKPKVVEVTPDNLESLNSSLWMRSSMMLPPYLVLIRELANTKRLNKFIAALETKTRAEEAERKRLEVEVEESRKAEKAEERIAEIERRLKTCQRVLGTLTNFLKMSPLTLQQYQTPTKTSSILTPLEPTRDQLQATVDQLKEFLQKPAGVVFLMLVWWTSSNRNLDSTISNLKQLRRKGVEPLAKKQNHKQKVSRLQVHQLDLQTKASE
uniref:Aminotransferase-like plant mobile domain-containing protein n=1 Tax=Fagus sylvatica TaxID=28930 RepID=A0A2N9E3P3_FAGSY